MVKETTTPRTRKREPRVRLSPAAALKWLESRDAMKALPANERRIRIRTLHRQRSQLKRVVCSAAWFDAQWHSAGVTYPPGGDDTMMIRCDECERTTPIGPCGGKRICYDCWIGKQSKLFLSMLPSSPGIIDMVKRAKNIRIGRNECSL